MWLTKKSNWKKLLIVGFLGNALFSLLGLFGAWQRYGELASHFRIQYFVIAFLFLPGFSWLRSWRWVIFSALFFALNAVIIFPHLSFSNHKKSEKYDFRLMLSNVYHGNKNYDGFLRLVRMENPDVLITQEASAGWREALQVLNSDYAYRTFAIQTEKDWILLFSKLPIVPEVEDKRRNQFPPILSTLEYKNKSITLFSLHPSTPKSGKGLSGRNLQFETLTAVSKSIAMPKIIMGDLNVSIWSPYFSKLENESGMTSVRNGFGILPTWPTWFSPLMIPIDHCLVSSEFEVLNCRTGSNIGSDHLPLIIDLALRN